MPIFDIVLVKKFGGKNNYSCLVYWNVEEKAKLCGFMIQAKIFARLITLLSIFSEVSLAHIPEQSRIILFITNIILLL